MLGKLMKRAEKRVPLYHTLGIRITEEQFQAVEAAAIERDRSITSLTRLIITEWLAEEAKLNETLPLNKPSPARVDKPALAATERMRGQGTHPPLSRKR